VELVKGLLVSTKILTSSEYKSENKTSTSSPSLFLYTLFLLLWFNDLKADQRKKPYIKVNIRELNGVLGTIYLPLYTN